MNTYTNELLQLMKNRYAEESDDMPMGEWLSKNTHLKGRKFSFNRYPFQRELVDDQHPNMVCIKPSQVGVSEIFQRWALGFLARHRMTKGIYAYPDDAMRKKNVQTRVMPMVEAEKVFNVGQIGGDKPVRSIELMQIAMSYLYMTGSKVGDATSTDADFVLLDEYDLHDMAIAALFSSRLQNSDFKIKKYFSTPTFTQFGVDKMFEESDQMYYMIRCDSCNHWQFPMFTPNFIEIRNLPGDWNDLLELDQSVIDTYNLGVADSYVCCEKCRAALDLGREDNRAWVPKYPSRTSLRGRKINPFSVATRPPSDIIGELLDYKRRGAMRGFKNSVLGEAEDSSTARLAEEIIRACMRGAAIPPVRVDIPTWIGIDMGHDCHVVVGQGYTPESVQVVRMFSVPIGKLQNTIKELDMTYMIVGGMVDRHPESQAAADVRDATQRRIVPCEYRGTKELHIIKDPEGNIIHCQADRTSLLDAVAQAVRLGQIGFAGYELREADVLNHLRDMVRVEEPEEPAVWKKLTGMDHFFHAIGFMLHSMKLKKLESLLADVPNVAPLVCGAKGFATTDMLGRTTRPDSNWQRKFLMV